MIKNDYDNLIDDYEPTNIFYNIYNFFYCFSEHCIDCHTVV